MTTRLLSNFWDVFIVVGLVSAISFLLLSILLAVEGGFQRKNAHTILKLLILVTAMSILGSVSGYAGGMSRTGVVGDIIPAALGLLGGVSLYLFGVQQNPTVVPPVAIASFALSLVLGFAQGADAREQRETFETVRNACFELFMDPRIMAPEALSLAQKTHGGICNAIFRETKSVLVDQGAPDSNQREK